MNCLNVLGFVIASVATVGSAFAGDAKVLAQLNNLNPRIESIAIQEDGLVKVTQRNHRVVYSTLKPPTLEQVTSLVATLRDAKIETTTSEVVCEMMIDPFVIFKLTIGAEPTQKTVPTFASCALSSYTAPKVSYEYANAVALKNVVEALGNEAIPLD